MEESSYDSCEEAEDPRICPTWNQQEETYSDEDPTILSEVQSEQDSSDNYVRKNTKKIVS